MKKVHLTLILIILAITLCGCSFSSNFSFNMTEINSQNGMKASYTRFSGNKKATFEVKSGETKKVNVSVVTDKGELSIKITNEDGKTFYQGDEMSTSDFDVILDEEGKYTVNVQADKHSGSYNINWN